MNNNTNQTNFGFKKILLEQKEKLVKEVFSSVSNKYDIMNDLMSFATHRLWKKHLVNLMINTKINTLLDVGGGTADIALEFIKKGGKKAVVLDINEDMLNVGREKVANAGYQSSFDFICANAEQLPFESNNIEMYSSSFCLRNVTNLEQAIKEAHRVLKSGGKFFCLEFSKVNNPLLEKAYDFWSFYGIPIIGKYVANNKQAYEYLVESIRKFPNQEDFASIIKAEGFVNVGYENIFNGIASIHFATKK
jgi:demethylmenaquinone methyltransferase/2-methoxy-6-polyprenyl-1,4-benzoquinol methylase